MKLCTWVRIDFSTFTRIQSDTEISPIITELFKCVELLINFICTQM